VRPSPVHSSRCGLSMTYREERPSSLPVQLAAVYWPLLQIVLHTVPLTAMDVSVVAVCSLAPIVVVEVLKLARR
jgi:hypothetical protein